MTFDIDQLTEVVKNNNAKFRAVKDEICKVIVGQRNMIDRLLISLIADGHVLLEGLPGLAKTLAVNTLAKVIQCDFKRIQFIQTFYLQILLELPSTIQKKGHSLSAKARYSQIFFLRMKLTVRLPKSNQLC